MSDVEFLFNGILPSGDVSIGRGKSFDSYDASVSLLLPDPLSNVSQDLLLDEFLKDFLRFGIASSSPVNNRGSFSRSFNFFLWRRVIGFSFSSDGFNIGAFSFWLLRISLE